MVCCRLVVFGFVCSRVESSHLPFPKCVNAGLPSFLAGKTYEPEEDPRGEFIPNPPVFSKEELLAQKAAQVNGKKEKQQKKQKPAEQAPAATIDVSKFDIRVGVITKAWEHEEADKLFCEEIDIGEEGGPRQIASGLRAHYKLEDLEGQRVLVLANLKSRKLMGFPSHGMVLCASSAEGEVKFVEPPAGAEIGERVFVDGYEGEPATENQIIKKKMLDAIFPDLKTDGNGVPTYKGVPLKTSAGPCASPIPNAEVA